MRTAVPTQLSLFEWSYHIGLNPFFVAQISEGTMLTNDENACENAMYQQPHMRADHLSREEVGQSIANAEQMIADYVGFWPAPKEFTNEYIPYSQYFDRRFRDYMVRADGQLKSVTTKYNKIIRMGTASESVIEAGRAVTLSDEDGDGLNETFTGTVTIVAGTTADELRFYFSAADRAGLDLADCEIKPVNVSISGTTATFTGHVSLLVKPELQIRPAPDALNIGDAATIFAGTVDVYRRVFDTTVHGSLIWERLPFVVAPYGGTTPCDTPPCSVMLHTACFGIRDRELGVIYANVAAYDNDTAAFVQHYPPQFRAPDRVLVNYEAGEARQSNGWVNNRYGRAVAKLATALLPNRKCGCNRADLRIAYYRDLPSEEGPGGAQFLRVSEDAMRSASAAFGTNARGAIEAMIEIGHRETFGGFSL